MHDSDSLITVVPLARADAASLGESRCAIAATLATPAPRILVDLSALDVIDGPILAAIFIASKEMPADGRFAVLASQKVMDTIEEWSLNTFWDCFTDRALAETHLLTGTHTLH
ncbi:MAG: hypothetical protein JXR33_00590 [Coriobacteriia bacterium]|nr:hypothetical protein [Coriobacteriia bacterium]